jgi:hypothetical protein
MSDHIGVPELHWMATDDARVVAVAVPTSLPLVTDLVT